MPFHLLHALRIDFAFGNILGLLYVGGVDLLYLGGVCLFVCFFFFFSCFFGFGVYISIVYIYLLFMFFIHKHIGYDSVDDGVFHY